MGSGSTNFTCDKSCSFGSSKPCKSGLTLMMGKNLGCCLFLEWDLSMIYPWFIIPSPRLTSFGWAIVVVILDNSRARILQRHATQEDRSLKLQALGDGGMLPSDNQTYRDARYVWRPTIGSSKLPLGEVFWVQVCFFLFHFPDCDFPFFFSITFWIWFYTSLSVSVYLHDVKFSNMSFFEVDKRWKHMKNRSRSSPAIWITQIRGKWTERERVMALAHVCLGAWSICAAMENAQKLTNKAAIGSFWKLSAYQEPFAGIFCWDIHKTMLLYFVLSF